ncbi:hypothetical protein QR98_0083020 [Sarcoptes scabiei]|uniref:Uncharacterized protein n=1 Tax=Sarcoptes scabiei TaxID=52283 RepID=A0A132AFQ6_SARSC|nr:hypothetical protein QR98_0083020 [Sarcoptes scabiei]
MLRSHSQHIGSRLRTHSSIHSSIVL